MLSSESLVLIIFPFIDELQHLDMIDKLSPRDDLIKSEIAVLKRVISN